MTMEFEMPKSFEDTKPPVILETREYRLRLTEKKVEANKAETGKNVVLTFAIFGENSPADGLEFTQWLALPNPSDEGKRTRQGQSMVDWKMDRIKQVVATLGGKIDGSKFAIPDVSTCRAMIEKIISDEGRPYNQIKGELMPDKPVGVGKGAPKKS